MRAPSSRRRAPPRPIGRAAARARLRACGISGWVSAPPTRSLAVCWTPWRIPVTRLNICERSIVRSKASNGQRKITLAWWWPRRGGRRAARDRIGWSRKNRNASGLHTRRDDTRRYHETTNVAVHRRIGAGGLRPAGVGPKREGHAARIACGRALHARPRDDLRGPDGRSHPVRRGAVGDRGRRRASWRDRRRAPQPRARRSHRRPEDEGARSGNVRQPGSRLRGTDLDDRRHRGGEELGDRHGRAAGELHRPQGRDDQGQAHPRLSADGQRSHCTVRRVVPCDRANGRHAHRSRRRARRAASRSRRSLLRTTTPCHAIC